MRKFLSGKKAFIFALFIIHAAFFIYVTQTGNIYLHNDSDEYLNQAENIKYHSSWYQGNWDEARKHYLDSRRPPLTGFVFMLAKQIFYSDYAILILNNLLSIFNLLLAAKLAENLFAFKMPVLLLLPLLFFPAQMIYSNMVMAEILFQTFLITAIYFLYRFINDKKTGSIFLFHFFLACAVLVKPVLFLLWIPLSALYVILIAKNKLKIVPAVTLLIFVMTIFLVSVRNYKTNGVFQYSSASENFLPNYAVLKTLQLTEGRDYAISTVDQIYEKANSTQSYTGYHETLINESFSQIRNYPFEFIVLSCKGVASFFCDPGRWDIFAFFVSTPEENMKGFFHYFKSEGISSAFNYLFSYNGWLIAYLFAAAVVNIFVAVSFFAFIFGSKAPAFFRGLLFILVIYLAACTGLIGSARFRTGVFPILAMTFPFGLAHLQAFVKKTLYK